MRKIDWLHNASSRQLVDHFHEINLIKRPFSDSAIFELQEKFLSNGFQYLKARNIVEGREIVSAFLQSLGLYHEVACLTTSSFPAVGPGVADLHFELTAGGYLDEFQPYFLDEFFFDTFYYDFMWIEATRSVLMSSWFEKVKTTLIHMGIDQQIPIVVLVYEE